MHTLLRIFFLLLACPAAIAAEPAPLEEVVVSASPHRKPARQLPDAVGLLSGRQLQRQLAPTLGNTLQNLPGVHASSFGPGVGRPIIRGQSGKRVEILQNGTTVADVSDLSFDHATTVDTLLADRIEILRGPAILRHGTGAIGGVVNVIDSRIHTEAFEGYDGDLAVRYNANNNERAAAARLDAGWERFILHLGATSRDSNDVDIPGNSAVDADSDDSTHGYIRNSSSDANSWNVGLSQVNDSWVVGLSVGQWNKDYGLPPGGHGHGDEHGHGAGSPDDEAVVRTDIEQDRGEFKLLFTELPGALERFDLGLAHTDYAHRELEITDSASTIGTRFDLRSLELKSELTYQGNWLGRGAVGAQYNNRDFQAVGEEAFVPASDTDRVGLYVLKERELGAASLKLGVRWDRQEITSGEAPGSRHDSFNLSAGALIPLAERHRVGMLISRSQRSPVAEELLSDGEHAATATYDIGDPGLGTESARNVELKWTYEGVVDAELNLYHSRFHDYLYQQDTELRFSHDLEEDAEMAGIELTGLDVCSDDLQDFDNDADEFEEAPECFAYRQRDAKFSGLEFEAGYSVNANHRLRFWGDYVRARFADGDVPRTPPRRLGLGWLYTRGAWEAELRLLRVFAQDRPGENEPRSAGYVRIDAGVDWRRGNWHLFLYGRNLADREIRNATSFLRTIAPEPGRELIAGARLQF